MENIKDQDLYNTYMSQIPISFTENYHPNHTNDHFDQHANHNDHGHSNTSPHINETD